MLHLMSGINLLQANWANGDGRGNSDNHIWLHASLGWAVRRGSTLCPLHGGGGGHNGGGVRRDGGYSGAAGMAGTLTGELGGGTLFVPETALFHEY